ncbi:MAG: hypothetical protein ACOH2V_00555 [Candidatus Saccharimonadaceae bacterium]
MKKRKEKERDRFKYINFSHEYSHEELREDFIVVINPTKYSKLPNGEYEIRGTKKEHSNTYWVSDNIWYLVEEKTRDNGHYIVDAAKYLLFPPLSEKEWKIMNQIPYNRLKKYWQRAREGYNTYMSLRKLTRSITLSWLTWQKEHPEENFE